MLDGLLQKLTKPAASSLAGWLATARIPAVAPMAAAIVAGLAAFAAVATGNYLWGLGLLVANRAFDWLAGSVAMGVESRRNEFLSLVFEAFLWAGIPFAFALADPSRALAASFLIFGFVFANAAYLAFAMVAARREASASEARPFFFPGGLVENTEALAALAIACAVPAWFGVVAYVLGALCFVTAGMRVAEAVAAFGEP